MKEGVPMSRKISCKQASVFVTNLSHSSPSTRRVATITAIVPMFCPIGKLRRSRTLSSLALEAPAWSLGCMLLLWMNKFRCGGPRNGLCWLWLANLRSFGWETVLRIRPSLLRCWFDKSYSDIQLTTDWKGQSDRLTLINICGRNFLGGIWVYDLPSAAQGDVPSSKSALSPRHGGLGTRPYWHTRVKSVVAPTARAGLVRPSLSLQVLRTRRELPPLHLGRVVPNKKGGGMETLDGLLLRPGHSSPARPKKGGQQLHCLQLSLYDISGLHVKGKYVGCHLTIPL